MLLYYLPNEGEGEATQNTLIHMDRSWGRGEARGQPLPLEVSARGRRTVYLSYISFSGSFNYAPPQQRHSSYAFLSQCLYSPEVLVFTWLKPSCSRKSFDLWCSPCCVQVTFARYLRLIGHTAKNIYLPTLHPALL